MKKTLKICAIGVSSSIHIIKRTQCFAKRGYEVALVSPVQEKVNYLDNLFVPLHSSKLGIPGYIYRLIKAIKMVNPDIIHIHYADFHSLLAAYLSGVPYIVTIMGSDIIKGIGDQSSSLRKFILLFLLSRAKLLNTKTEYLTNIIKQHIKNVRCLKTYWGVDLNIFKKINKRQARINCALAENEFIILSPRILKPFYNIDLIVQSFERFNQMNQQSRLLICEYIVDETYKKKLKELINELGISQNVQFMGYVNNHDMVQLYNAADISIAVPDHDGMPISLFEAFACGVPNILPRLDAYNELLTDRETVLYVDFQADDIANKMYELSINDELRDSIIKNGLKLVEEKGNFDHDLIKLEQIMSEVVKKA